MYKWNGDNKLCIPGMNKIHPGGTFELGEEHLGNAGVIQLMKQGLIVPVEPAVATEQTGTGTENAAEIGAGLEQTGAPQEPVVPQGPAEIQESQEPQELQEPQKPGKDRRRR